MEQDYEQEFDTAPLPEQPQTTDFSQDLKQLLQPTLKAPYQRKVHTHVKMAKMALSNATLIYQSQLKRPVYQTSRLIKPRTKKSASATSKTVIVENKIVEVANQDDDPKTIKEIRKPTRDLLKERIELMRRKRSKFTRQLHQDYMESYGRPASNLQSRAKSALRIRSDADRQEDMMTKIIAQFEKPKNERPSTSPNKPVLQTHEVRVKPTDNSANKVFVRPKTSHELVKPSRDSFLKRFSTPVRQGESTHFKCKKLEHAYESNTETQTRRQSATVRTQTPSTGTQFVRACSPLDSKDIVLYPKFIGRQVSSSFKLRDRHAKCQHAQPMQCPLREPNPEFPPSDPEVSKERHQKCIKLK